MHRYQAAAERERAALRDARLNPLRRPARQVLKDFVVRIRQIYYAASPLRGLCNGISLRLGVDRNLGAAFGRVRPLVTEAASFIEFLGEESAGFQDRKSVAE